MKKICVVVGSRANYASIKSVMEAIKNHPRLSLQVIVGASALLDKYGSVVELIEDDGFKVDHRIHMLIEGETPLTMARSTGLGLLELPTVFENLKPDAVITVGDRFETIATAIAAAYMNIPVAHTMGGEITGTIDESVRHAVTKLAHIHFPANQEAAENIIKMGEEPEHVHNVGCPRIDLVADIIKESSGPPTDQIIWDGVGDPLDLNSPYLMVSQHPVTSEFGGGQQQITQTLEAVRKTNMQAIILWPNADAGSDDISRGIRLFRNNYNINNIHIFKNLPVNQYIELMHHTACLIGNSSSGIREGAFMGTPCVNIGTRQHGRSRGRNVIDVPYDTNKIHQAITKQINSTARLHDPIYGDGNAGVRIAEILSKSNVKVQKRLTFNQ